MNVAWKVKLDVQVDDFLLSVDFAVDAQVVALFGASGCGKSTLVEALCGVRPAAGQVELDGNCMMSEQVALEASKRQIGWVPQDAALFPHLTVLENISFAGKGVNQHAVAVLGLSDLLNRLPSQLSGGERQRVALARALSSDPKMLVLDEPLSAVDLPRRARVFSYLLQVRREFALPILYVSHDPAEVLAIADQVVLLERGQQVGIGTPQELLADVNAMRFLDRLGFENVFCVSALEKRRQGHALLVETLNGSQLVAPAPPRTNTESNWLAVQADDVILAICEPVGLSARNIFAGTIAAIESSGDHLLVKVNTGDEWVASLTRRAVDDLGFKLGAKASVVVKTHSLHWLAE